VRLVEGVDLAAAGTYVFSTSHIPYREAWRTQERQRDDGSSWGGQEEGREEVRPSLALLREELSSSRVRGSGESLAWGGGKKEKTPSLHLARVVLVSQSNRSGAGR
jgi:hypothetical protein